MITIKRIQSGFEKIAQEYPIKKCFLFGSYANGNATEESDLDFLIEFNTPAVSLLTISSLRNSLADEFALSVDVLHYPVPDDSLIKIDNMVNIYG